MGQFREAEECRDWGWEGDARRTRLGSQVYTGEMVEEGVCA